MSTLQLDDATLLARAGSALRSPSHGLPQQAALAIPNFLHLPSEPADGGDSSRKRCASLTDENRVAKAIKLEPAADPLLPPTSSTSSSLPPPLLPVAGTSSAYPPYPPASAPPLMTLAEHSPPGLASAPSIDMMGVDVSVNGAGMGWPQRPPPQHRHTLSGSSLTDALAPPTSSGGGPPPFTTAGAFGPAPGHAPNGRLGRALSISQQQPQFAYGLDEGGMQQMSPSGSSVDLDDEDGSAGSSKGQSPAHGRDVMSSRPGTSHGSAGRVSGGADALGAANALSNEVPQEYRADVDRIFFGFLGKICSDCESIFFRQVIDC